MNLNPGGKQPLIRPGMFNKQEQPMIFSADHPDEALRSKAKGMKQILVERGLWPESGKLLARCYDGCKTDATNCCAEKTLSLQPDFHAQKSLIAETIEAAGHRCIFYPKYSIISSTFGVQQSITAELTATTHGKDSSILSQKHSRQLICWPFGGLHVVPNDI